MRVSDRKNAVRFCAAGLWLAVVGALPMQAFAESAQEACTAKVAEALPKAAGVTIGNTRATMMQPPEAWNGRSAPFLVEVDFIGGGTTGTYRYWCALGSDGEAIVQRLTQ
jgi:hypothetical protein